MQTVVDTPERAQLTWEAPPPRERGGKKGQGLGQKHRPWAAIVLALKANPREWAVVATDTDNWRMYFTANDIRSANIRAFGPKASFEAVARTFGGVTRVYARYVGESAEPAA